MRRTEKRRIMRWNEEQSNIRCYLSMDTSGKVKKKMNQRQSEIDQRHSEVDQRQSGEEMQKLR